VRGVNWYPRPSGKTEPVSGHLIVPNPGGERRDLVTKG